MSLHFLLNSVQKLRLCHQSTTYFSVSFGEKLSYDLDIEKFYSFKIMEYHEIYLKYSMWQSSFERCFHLVST